MPTCVAQKTRRSSPLPLADNVEKTESQLLHPLVHCIETKDKSFIVQAGSLSNCILSFSSHLARKQFGCRRFTPMSSVWRSILKAGGAVIQVVLSQPRFV